MRLKSAVMCSLLVALIVSPLWGAEKASPATDKLKTDAEKTSYALGMTIGRQVANMLKGSQTDVIAKYFAIAIQDILEARFGRSEEGRSQRFLEALAGVRPAPGATLRPQDVTAADLAVFGYLRALEDYFELSPASEGAGLSGLAPLDASSRAALP